MNLVLLPNVVVVAAINHNETTAAAAAAAAQGILIFTNLKYVLHTRPCHVI